MSTLTVNSRSLGGVAARNLIGDDLAAALRDARTRTQQVLAHWRGIGCLPAGTLPLAAEFNPPAWEAGHVAWFQDWWLARFAARQDGADADPNGARVASRLPGADRLYDSSAVAHDRRWELDLPAAQVLDDYLAQTLESTLALLVDLACDGAPDERARNCYFHRLALFHEDMHSEAAIYMANHFASWPGMSDAADFTVFAPPAVWDVTAADRIRADTPDPQPHALPQGFAFDNELPAIALPAIPPDMDQEAVSAGSFLRFIEAGGYREQRFWSPAGWTAQQATGRRLPRFHRFEQGSLQRCCFGRWRTLTPHEAIVHVSAHEAEAWCRWAGRRLPSEGEWQAAACGARGLVIGSGWEWTASTFLPFPGFRPHPYRDYSQPWFGTHRVLKGAAPSTPLRLRIASFRNFYPPGRSDIFSTFRSCAP